MSASFADSKNPTIQSVEISTAREDFTAMIQTDKSKYKPGDVINMRLLFVHFNGRPVNDTRLENFHFEVHNRYGESIWTESETLYSPKVYTYQIDINEEAFIGNYTIFVWVNRQVLKNIFDIGVDGADEKVHNVQNFEKSDAISKHNFVVEKYLLREYVLTVETKKVVSPSRMITVRIYATYTFGKDAIGNAKVTAYLNGVQFHTSEIRCDYLGVAKIRFNKNLLNQNGTNQVKIDVEYQDILSRQKVYKTVMVSVQVTVKKTMIMEPSNVIQYFKPGIPFSVNVYLKDIDGNFVEFSANPIEIELEQKFQPPKCSNVNAKSVRQNRYYLKPKNVKNYVAQFEVEDVPLNTSSMTFTAFHENTQAQLIVGRLPTPSAEYMRVTAK